MSKEDFESISSHICFYDSISHLILDGDLYRLLSPFEGNYFAQIVVSRDKKEAAFILMKMSARSNDCYPVVKLKGLDEELMYEIAGMGVYSGSVLMNVGLKFRNNLWDFETICFRLKEYC